MTPSQEFVPIQIHATRHSNTAAIQAHQTRKAKQQQLLQLPPPLGQLTVIQQSQQALIPLLLLSSHLLNQLM